MHAEKEESKPSCMVEALKQQQERGGDHEGYKERGLSQKYSSLPLDTDNVLIARERMGTYSSKDSYCCRVSTKKMLATRLASI
ncbi:MAG: hypothetical protein GY820_24290 [Gammaproteobacteria bacterium]|nr:hypothetical protein [Gammaproteobacteria bacterium]